MQAAYQEFMLKGKKKTTANSGVGGVSTPSPSSKQKGPPHPASLSPSKRGYSDSHRGTPRPSTTAKGVRPILKAFQGRLQDWKDADEQSELVLGSILNLRDRLAWESGHLQKIQDAPSSKEPSWVGWGFREPTSNSGLSEEDVELALHHDLLQHERMMAALRGLLSSMAQAMDAMGRRLDEWMVTSYQQDHEWDGGATASAFTLEAAKQVYSFLSEELYRKQVLVQSVLDSCHDGLIDQESIELYQRGNPRQVVRNACKGWMSKDEETKRAVDRLLTVNLR